MKTIIRGHEIAGRMPLFQEWGRRAIRAGEKTQTRRVLKPQPTCTKVWVNWLDEWATAEEEGGEVVDEWKIPIQVGDIRVMTEPLAKGKEVCGKFCAAYADDGKMVMIGGALHVPEWRWKRDTLSAMYMPHEAARTLCEITGVRVERLKAIGEEDGKAEGVQPWHADNPEIEKHNRPGGSYRNGFHEIWDKINGKKYPWSSNPWVIVYDFKVV